MRLVKKALRGEKVKTFDWGTCTFLKYQPNGFALVIAENGKILAIHKNRLDLPMIDATGYQKAG